MDIVANKMNISLKNAFSYQIIVVDLTLLRTNVQNAILIIIFRKTTVVNLGCFIRYKKKNAYK
jgi:hypothetical protein